MNGRIYDPLIGRFMSADPYIQAPDDLQSHNRYAYVMNNPLNLTDPSGFNWLTKTWKKAWKSPIFRAVLGIVVAIAAPYLLHAIAPTLFVIGSLPTALATGALSGFASTGTLKGALTGAFTAGVMFGVGEIAHTLKEAGVGGFDAGGIGKVALHAGAGCITSVAGGGDCKTGALSGGVGELGNLLPSGGREFNTFKAAMLGGIGSKIAGGKFEDGAVTGAFGYLFNDLSTHGKDPNTRGTTAVDEVKADFESKGVNVIGREVNAYIDGQPTRRYDLVIQNQNGSYTGIEVKSSIFDNFKLNPQQVIFDTTVYSQGGASFNAQGAKITQVSYVGVGFGGSASARWSSSSLTNSLQTQGISMTTQRSLTFRP